MMMRRRRRCGLLLIVYYYFLSILIGSLLIISFVSDECFAFTTTTITTAGSNRLLLPRRRRDHRLPDSISHNLITSRRFTTNNKKGGVRFHPDPNNNNVLSYSSTSRITTTTSPSYFQHSPLFTATAAATTTLTEKTSSSSSSSRQVRRWPPQRCHNLMNNTFFIKVILRRVLVVLSSLVFTTIASTNRVWASEAVTTMKPKLSSIKLIYPWTKRLVQILINIWIASLFIANYRMRLRQKSNATSEWARYAKHPAARGRSIMWLLTQQAAFIFVSQLLKFVPAKRQKIREKAGRHLANSLLRLGPLYVKLGQIISCRKNLLGPEWIDAMAILQDQIPARSGQEALDLAYSTLDGGQIEFDELFIDFDPKPLAAASLGQVHRATLRETGDVVAVKVQRPFLRQIYDQDLKFLTTIAQWMDKMPSSKKNVGGISSSWTKIFHDAEEILYREIDYRDEADNAVRFSNDFGLTLGGQPITPTAKARNNQTLPSAADWIRTPYVFQNISNERLLVMEYVPSIKITNTAKLDAANITTEDKFDLADSLARAYLRQFCCNLFFSTDPHPGNLGVEIVPTTNKPRLVMYDFGQAATLNQGQADGILSIIEAIIDMDVDRSIKAFQQMDVLVDGADLDKVRSKVADNYRTGKVKANRKRLRRKGYQFADSTTTNDEEEDDNNKDKEEEEEEEISDSNSNNKTATSSDGSTATTATTSTTTTTTKAKDSEVMSYFSLPAEYAFVARALSQMDGVGKTLDPDFDFISNAAPYIVEIKGADKYLKEEIIKVVTNFEKKVTKFQMGLLMKKGGGKEEGRKEKQKVTE